MPDFSSSEEHEQRSLLAPRTHFKDPVSNAAERWLASLSKAMRGMRVYDANNKMLVRFLEKAEEDLKALHALAEEVTLSIREDRVLYASTVGGVVRVESVEVEQDAANADEIKIQIARKLTPLREAYERALERDQALGGVIIFCFVIREGRARDYELLDNPVADEGVARTLESCAESWMWPGKDSVIATVHLELKPVRREDPVLVDPDREEGFPFAFYRNGFRRLTFVRGFGMPEMTQFLRAVATDFGAGDSVGEDLVSVLWRLDLPFFRYLTIDGLTIGTAEGSKDREQVAAEIDRLQADVDNLVAQIYAQSSRAVDDADLVNRASITRDDLHALEGIQSESDEDLDQLDLVTARAITNVTREEIDPIYAEVKYDDREAVIPQLIDALVAVLYDTESSKDIARKLELIQLLFDALFLRSGFAHATHLLQQIRGRAEATSDLRQMHIARHVLNALATESRVAQIIGAFGETVSGTTGNDVVAFLRALGPGAMKHVLKSIDLVGSPTHRRLLIDLVGDLDLPHGDRVREVIETAKWFVVVDLMALVARLPIDQQAAILRVTASHENPKVRAQTIGMLRAFPEGGADDLIARAINDPEPDVRIAAGRVAAARMSRKVGAALGEWIRSDQLGKSEPRELTAMMLAFATIGGAEAVKTLDGVLNPGLFQGKVDAQVSAAIALGAIHVAEAKASLQRGSRTLNGKVREACKQALIRQDDPGSRHHSTVGVGQDPFAIGAELSLDLEPEQELAPAPANGVSVEPERVPIPRAPVPRAPTPLTAANAFIVRGNVSQDVLPPPRSVSSSRGVPPAPDPRFANDDDLGIDEAPAAADARPARDSSYSFVRGKKGDQ